MLQRATYTHIDTSCMQLSNALSGPGSRGLQIMVVFVQCEGVGCEVAGIPVAIHGSCAGRCGSLFLGARYTVIATTYNTSQAQTHHLTRDSPLTET